MPTPVPALCLHPTAMMGMSVHGLEPLRYMLVFLVNIVFFRISDFYLSHNCLVLDFFWFCLTISLFSVLFKSYFCSFLVQVQIIHHILSLLGVMFIFLRILYSPSINAQLCYDYYGLSLHNISSVYNTMISICFVMSVIWN